MTGLSALIRPEGLREKVCIFGAPKTGKTQLCGQLTLAGFQLIYIDVANEGSVLLKLPLEAQERIVYVPVQDTSESPLAHATVDKLVRGGNFRVCLQHGRVSCPTCKTLDDEHHVMVNIPTERTEENRNVIVVIDNMSQVSQAVAFNIMKGKTKVDAIPDMDKETIQRVAEKEAFEDYRIQGRYLDRILSFIQTAPYHCIVTAHEVEGITETGLKKIVPYIGTTNYSANVGRFFGHMIYTEVVNGKYRAISSAKGSNKVMAGSRLDVVLDNMEVPDLLPIFDYQSAKNTSSVSIGVPNTNQQAKTVLSNIAITTTPTHPIKKTTIGIRK